MKIMKTVFLAALTRVDGFGITGNREVMGMDTNKLTFLRPLYMGIIENVAPKRST